MKVKFLNVSYRISNVTNFVFLITEAVLETLKRIKPIIDQSKSGFKGQPGPPGPKGDPAPLPSGPISE